MSEVFRAGLVSSGIREELDLVDRVRSLLENEKEVGLPGIVVVGNTSVGKSSVLESISGVEFPKGSQVTTTCPIRLVLRSGSAFAASVNGTSVSEKGLIGQHIRSAMEEAVRNRPASVARATPGFAGTVIEVKLCEPDLPDLTLLDLPGILNSGGAKDFVKALIQQHISYEENVIVCVLDMTSNLTNQNAIDMAKEADPAGKRTLGIVTKPDRAVSADTNALDQLGSGAFQMGLGFVVVRNRTQEEISANLSAHEAAERERQFFDGEGLSGVSAHVSEALKVLPPEQKGKQALIDLLLKVQGSRLKDSLVPVKKKVNDRIKSKELELGRMSIVAEDDYAAMHQLAGMSAVMTKGFEHLKQGMFSSVSIPVTDDLHVDPRLREFTKGLRDKVWGEIGGKKFFAQQACVAKIRHAIGEANELLPDMVNDGPAFTEIYHENVHSKLAGPAESLVTEMKAYLLEVWIKLVKNAFEEFPRLSARVVEEVDAFMHKKEQEALAFVSMMVKHQRAVFTSNPRFAQTVSNAFEDIRAYQNALQGHAALVQQLEQLQLGAQLSIPPQPPVPAYLVAWDSYPELRALASRMQNEYATQTILERNVTKMQFQLAVYTDIVVDRIGDDMAMGAKVILVDEVLQVHGGLSQALNTSFSGGDQVLGLMQDPDQARRRRELQTSLVALKEARRELNAHL